MHVGFRALDGLPAGGKSLRIAQLYAAASPMRFLATTKAPACRNFPQQRRRVREQCERAGQEGSSKEARPPEDSPRHNLGNVPTHGRYSVEGLEKNRSEEHTSELQSLPTISYA